MKRLPIFAMLSSMALLFMLSSCGNSADEKATEKDTTTLADTNTTAITPATPVSTIVTTPVIMAVVTHKVKNYAEWLASYEADDSARLANGLHNYVIGRGLVDTNMVMVALKANDATKAKNSIKDPRLKAIMQKAGVTGTPQFAVLNSTWQDTAALGTTLRSRTSMNVKDWDAWIKAFEDGRQERIDNGIVDRVIGYDTDDNKKVTLVTAVTDTAKAFAYYKSDALKKRREVSGVVGEPVRFLFNVVKRY